MEHLRAIRHHHTNPSFLILFFLSTYGPKKSPLCLKEESSTHPFQEQITQKYTVNNKLIGFVYTVP